MAFKSSHRRHLIKPLTSLQLVPQEGSWSMALCVTMARHADRSLPTPAALVMVSGLEGQLPNLVTRTKRDAEAVRRGCRR